VVFEFLSFYDDCIPVAERRMSSVPPSGLCYVSYVSNDVIVLQGANRRWRAWLRAGGLPLSWWSGGVPYRQRGDDDLSDFLPKMATLARLGVRFTEDYKQGMAPADIMRDLQERGLLHESFVAVSWGGPGERRQVRHDPPAA
jgi:hypothetical protein